MAAEKLTRARLIQIIFLMVVLISAFTWRTLTYEPISSVNPPIKSCDLTNEKCEITLDKKIITIDFSTRPLSENSTLELTISGEMLQPVAMVEGVDMFMGSIPITFSESSTGWNGEFFIPACTHSKMTWQINLDINNENETLNFTVFKDQ